ncbi:MAG TPA: hypothetical protein VKQ32_25580 [Polyangia bacterium]|nr:hypothetical protein [Polyangia bacterium]
MTARIFNVLIGAWLFLSAFAWPHTHGQKLAAMIVGALTVVLSLAASYIGGLRYLIAVMAVMLFVMAVTGTSHWNVTLWHNAIVALAIFVAALLDRGPAGTRREREIYGRI